MTATDVPALVCPVCGNTNIAIGGSGNAICTDCTHMWNPADPQPVPPAFDIEVPGAMAITPATLADADRVGALEDELAQLEGGVATLEGGQTATVVTFKWPESVVVELGNGDLQIVPLDAVQRIMPPIVIPDPVDVPDTVDALPADLQLALELARTIIRAGAESVEGSGANVTPGMPPIGYLPADPELLPVIERAAGIAVGMLIERFELDVDEILVYAGAVREQDQVATETTEVTEDDNPSGTE